MIECLCLFLPLVSTLECLLVSKDFLRLTPLHTIQGDGQWETEATIVGWKIRTTDTRQPILYSNECPVNDGYVNTGFDLSEYLVAQTRKAH